MADLITAARAKQAINQTTFTGDEDARIAVLVSAVSEAVQRWCRRTLTSTSHDERQAGTCTPRLLLDQFPIQSISRVQASPRAVLFIRNDGGSQLARIAVGDAGLTLIRVTSGTTTTDTSITWASYATLQAVVMAIVALGNGWSARVESDFALYPSAELPTPQGSLDAQGREAGLVLYTEELADYDIDAEAGWLERAVEWPGGSQAYRVRYTAGYTTIPDDVQEACAQWVAALFWQTKDNPAATPDVPTGAVRFLLAPFRLHPLG